MFCSFFWPDASNCLSIQSFKFSRTYGTITITLEIEGFSEIYFKKKLTKGDHGQLDAMVQTAVKRFINAYGDNNSPNIDLEKFYIFVKHLLPALPFSGEGDPEDLSHEIELKLYRADYQEAGEIKLDDGEEADSLRNPGEGGSGGGSSGELLVPLSEIIREFNERYGLNFREEDIHWMHDVEAQTEADEILVQQARNSDPSAFKTVYDEKALDLLIDKREHDEDLFNVLVSNDSARGFLFEKMRDAFMRRVLADMCRSETT